jgi:DNA invertase Pin-like site-specific DNA recombinase
MATTSLARQRSRRGLPTAPLFLRKLAASDEVRRGDCAGCSSCGQNRNKSRLLAAVAELEVGLNSERTKAALQAARARGTRLGNPRLHEAAGLGTASLRASAARRAANVLPVIRDIQRSGIESHNAIAAELNRRGVKTARGGRWAHVQVGQILARTA